jgi:DNA-binding GntR family transcriptional regulator
MLPKGLRVFPSTDDHSHRRNRLPLSDEVATYVRALIMSRSMRPGEFVRLEKIAEELGVSATPVREGLHALRGEGFLEFEPRRGFVVAPLSPEDIEDLFLVQADIAGELAARAARVATPDVVRELRRLQSALDEANAAGQMDRVVELNHRVHKTINLLAASPKLSFMLSVAVRYVPQPFFVTIEGWVSAAVHDHGRVFAALEANDPDDARAGMRTHILHAGTLLAQHFRQKGLAEEAGSAAIDTGLPPVQELDAGPA